jgi:hypothetical protein
MHVTRWRYTSADGVREVIRVERGACSHFFREGDEKSAPPRKREKKEVKS